MSSFIKEPNVITNHEFEIIEPIVASGATSQCFVVQKNGKKYFLKSLHPDLLDNAYYRTLFRKEFELGQAVCHSNVVKYVQFQDDVHDCFILSEYVCGETLADKIKSDTDYFASRANLDKFFNQLLSALKCLHNNHVAYSDLKPQNIMLSQVGNDVKLVDLGYCFTDAYNHTAGTTRGYSAPEQLKNGRIDITTDIYGVGKIIEYIGLNIPCNLPNIYAKIMMQCTKEQQKDRIQDTDKIVELINRRKHTIRNTILWGVACVVLFLAVRTVIYLEVVNSWWDSFELFSPQVEHDTSHCHTYYKVLSEEEGTCAVVGHSSSPNVYILDRVEINNRYYRVTEIADSAFRGKTYIRSVYIPEGITRIGVEAFLNCHKLVTLNLPNSVESIERAAFFDCHRLTHLRMSPDITYLGNGAFSGTNISSVTIPDSITQLKLDLFGNCEALQHVTIPQAVTKIERGVFYNCPALKEITIPQNVESIGEYAFYDCENLTDIYCMATIPPEILSMHRNLSQITVHVPAESVEAYRNAPFWQDMNIVAIEE